MQLFLNMKSHLIYLKGLMLIKLINIPCAQFTSSLTSKGLIQYSNRNHCKRRWNYDSVLYYDHISKRESLDWSRKGELPTRKFRVYQSTKNVIATIFWNCGEGIIFKDSKETNITVNEKYCARSLGIAQKWFL